MAPKRQREIAFAVLAVVLVLTIVWRVRSAAPAASAPARPADSAAPSANQQPANQRDPAEIDLTALEAGRTEPADSDRNPFRFKTRPAPSPVAMPKSSSAPAAPEETGPVEPPLPPPIPLKYIGLVSQDDPKVGRVAVLSDTRGVYYGREGEIIEGRYRILKIGVESIDLAYLDGRGRQTIRQTGQ
jgi:hypothetical protein